MRPPAPLSFPPLRRTWLALALAAIAPAALPAQVVTDGTLSLGGGATLLDGDRASFQKLFRQKKDGYGGLENFSVSRYADDSTFHFDARLVPGNADYLLAARYERSDAFFIAASYQRFRTFYDGSGGRLLPKDLAISYFDESLGLDRSFLTLELGTLARNAVQWRLRYDRTTRSGAKNSIRWGDSNLAGAPFSPRAFIPSYLLVDEESNTVTAEADYQSETTHWKATGRYQHTRVADQHVARRRALEPQDRYETMRDGYAADLFSGHAFYERIFNENFRVSAGGLTTTIDTHLSGSRLYGDSPDATVARAQSGDVGYYGLVGQTRLKQYLGNLNAYYQPTPRIAILAGAKYERLRLDDGEDHFDTSVSGTPATTVGRATAAASRNVWNEITSDLEVRYLRWADWQLSARGQWNQGLGDLVENSILSANGSSVIDRDTDYRRAGQRYTANATWYARPGLTFAAQYNYRLKLADYHARRDNTSNATTSKDRYPQFIVDQDLESHDASFRLSWRPASTLNLATRYAYQRALVTTTFDNLPAIRDGRLTRHVLTQSATWNATARLYFTGAVNLTYDQLWIPPHRLTVVADNNYTSASLGAGYALGQVTDLFLDLSHYRADNYTNDPEVTLPLNSGLTTQSAFLTWVRRQNARLTYTAKYGYATNRDGTYGGQNDFTAHVFYGKVQLKF